MRAYGIEPDSNQQSNTSSTRFSGDFPVGDGISSLSIKCLCRSSIFRPVSFSSSATLPGTMTSPSGLRQIGSGVPQKRLRLIAQSRAFSSHLPNRPSRRCAGTQLIDWLFLTILSRSCSARTNQVEIVR